MLYSIYDGGENVDDDGTTTKKLINRINLCVDTVMKLMNECQ